MKYTLNQVKDSLLWRDVLSRAGRVDQENYEFLLFLLFRAVNIGGVEQGFKLASERYKTLIEIPLVRSFLWDSVPEGDFWRGVHVNCFKNLTGEEWVNLIQK